MYTLTCHSQWCVYHHLFLLSSFFFLARVYVLSIIPECYCYAIWIYGMCWRAVHCTLYIASALTLFSFFLKKNCFFFFLFLFTRYFYLHIKISIFFINHNDAQSCDVRFGCVTSTEYAKVVIKLYEWNVCV